MQKLVILILFTLHSSLVFGETKTENNYANTTSPSSNSKTTASDVDEAYNTAKLASEKLTGGLMQLESDKQIEKTFENVEQIKACKKEVAKDIATLKPDDLQFDKLVENTKYPSCAELKKVIDKDKIKNLFSNNQDALKFYNVDGTRFQGDKTYTELKKYLSERMEKAIYGEAKDKNAAIGVTNHEVFYDLYRKQIGKAFLLNLSEYCVDYYYSGNNDYSGNQESNISLDADIKTESDKYKSCLASVACQCYHDDPNLQNKVCTYKDKSGVDKSYTTVNKKEVTQMACTLVSRLRQMKQEIAYLNTVDEGFSKLGGSHVKGATAYNGTEKDKSIDDLTDITSKEYEENVSVDKNDVDKCSKIAASGQLDQNCQLGQINAETLASLQIEHSIKTKVLEEELNNIQDTDKDALKEYFKKRDLLTSKLEEEIEKNAEQVKKEALAKLQTERENIIANINKQVQENNVVVDNNNKILNQDKGAEATKRAETQVDRMKRLIHFTNIISGYMDTDNKFYTKTLKREVADQGAASNFVKDQNYFQQLSSNTEDQINKDSSESSGLFSIGEINKLLGE